MKEAVQGEEFVARAEKGTQDRIKADKVRALLTPAQVLSVTETIDMDILKTTRISGSKLKFEIPNLDNMTPPALADELGKLRERIKNDQKLEGIYKDVLKAKQRKFELEEEERKVREAEKKAKKAKAASGSGTGTSNS